MLRYIESQGEFWEIVLASGDTRPLALQMYQNGDDPLLFEFWLANKERPFGRFDGDVMEELRKILCSKGGEATVGSKDIGAGAHQVYFTFTWA